MTLQRDLVWENLDLAYRASVSYQYARYALRLKYELLPDEVIHAAKRCLLDTLGCAIGASDAPGRPMVENVVKAIGGTEESTVFGSGLRTSALNATLVNSFLVRYLDCNDLGGGGHNSDSISAILAIAEREKVTGKDLLTSIVIAYELGARFAECRGPNVGFDLGDFNGDLRGGLTMPPALGKMMKLDEDQIANAIGICASHSHPLGILDTDHEENTMTKNLRFGRVAYDAILSCLLAKQGFTGPIRIVEGEKGIKEALFKGDMDIERLIDFSGWRILKTGYKALCANLSTQGHVSATLAIVRENDLKPEDIVSVHLSAGARENRHCTSLPKKYPRNAETADHSAFYANAIAIKERQFGPAAFAPEKFTDPVVLDLIEKITIEYDPSFPEHGYSGGSKIMTKDGRKFTKRVDHIHGFEEDPMTDKDLEDKFRGLAAPYISEQNMQRIFKTVWNLEKTNVLSDLMKLIVY